MLLRSAEMSTSRWSIANATPDVTKKDIYHEKS
jgi:hypothetical protein